MAKKLQNYIIICSPLLSNGPRYCPSMTPHTVKKRQPETIGLLRKDTGSPIHLAKKV